MPPCTSIVQGGFVSGGPPDGNLVSMKDDLPYLLRDGVLFRHFPDSTVAFHPDTGDTLVLEPACGRILEVLKQSKLPLAAEQIVLQSSVESSVPVEQFELWLDELLANDLVRNVDP